MKIILSAFFGKLTSQPIDVPDNSPPEILLHMDIESPSSIRDTHPQLARPTLGRFVASDSYLPIPHTPGSALTTARVYRLVELK